MTAGDERLRELRAGVADLAAVIERVAGDLALAEEPAGFVAALEAGAPNGERQPAGRGGDR